jgi:hypothetical protein
VCRDLSINSAKDLRTEWVPGKIGELWIGDYLLSYFSSGIISIFHRSGEGGAYQEKQVEAAIRRFVGENF